LFAKREAKEHVEEMKDNLYTFALDLVDDGVLLIENGSISFINKSLYNLCCTTFRSNITTIKECIGLTICQFDLFGKEEDKRELEYMIERVTKENKEQHHIFRFYEDNGGIIVDVVVDCIPYSEQTLCCIFRPQRNFKEDDLQTKLERLEMLEVYLNRFNVFM
jgi:hypothetical protein